MWSALKPVLLELAGSKKFLVLLSTCIAWAIARLGFDVDQSTIDRALLLIGAWLGAQSVSDHANAKREAVQLEAAKVVAATDDLPRAMATFRRLARMPAADDPPAKVA